MPPGFGMNRPSSSCKSSASDIGLAVFPIIFMFVLGFGSCLTPDAIGESDLSEQEIARIDSMKALIKNAPESSIVVRSDDARCRERIQAIAWISETRFFPLSLGVSGAYPVVYSSDDNYFTSVKEVIYPDNDQYNEYLQRLAILPSDCIKEGS